MSEKANDDSAVDRLWLEGVDRLDDGDTEAAFTLFARAVQIDPTAADAWLGLHATGRRGNESIAAMLQHSAAFGGLRNRLSRELHSEFQIGAHVRLKLEDARDLRLAGTAALLNGEQYPSALDRLLESDDADEAVRFLLTRHAALTKNWPDVARYAGGIEHPLLHEEAQLYVGMAELHLDRPSKAYATLMLYPQDLPEGGPAEAAFALWKGKALEAMGHQTAASEHIATARRLDPQGTLAAEKVAPGDASPADRDEPDRAERLRAALAELDALIGLEPVKREIRQMEAQYRMGSYRDPGGRAALAPKHLVFTGPSGTGKTTVARIIGELFAGLGVLESGHVVETHRVELVGRYMGHTAVATDAKIDEALDGVLFIDEAHGLHLSEDGRDWFGAEAIQTLVARAENDRHRLTVILAGYPDEMARLMQANSGLRSRFATTIMFPSFSESELVRIAEQILHAEGSILTDEASDALRYAFFRVVSTGAIDRLGNGRFARNLCAKIGINRDFRLSEQYPGEARPPEDRLWLIEIEDVAEAFRDLTGGEPGL